MGNFFDRIGTRKMTKIWSRQVPVFGGLWVLSTLASTGVAVAANPTVQPSPTSTPGFATPDQAVRRLAMGSINTQPITSPLNSPAENSNKVAPIAAISSKKSVMLSPSQVMNNCRGGDCEFNSAQPPVSLGTASPLGINQSPAPRAIPAYTTPSVVSEVPATVVPEEKSSTEKEKLADQSAVIPAEKAATRPSSIMGGVNQQLASLKDMAINSSRQFMTVLPRIDQSLLAIGNGVAPTKSLSFSPRLTLGNSDSTISSRVFTIQQPPNNSMLLLAQAPTKKVQMLLLLKNLEQTFY
jgi:hypothetical protein